MQKIENHIKQETKQIKKLAKGINNISFKTKNRKRKFKQRNARPRRAGARNGQNLRVTNPVSYRGFRKPELLQQMRSYNKMMRDKYLVGLIHPDIAYKEGIPVKLYNDVPIPTSTVSYCETYQFTTSSLGTFLLSWRPDYLMSSTYSAGIVDYSKITYNNSSSLNGTSSTSGNNFISGHYIPTVAYQRYRLVSALIRIAYNGPVLNQSGRMIACASYDPLRVCLGTTGLPVSGFSDSLIDRFGNFSTIANGLWPQKVNISQGDHGVECLWVPTDADDTLFERDGFYYGKGNLTAGLMEPDSEGAHIAYLISGNNLPASTSCIYAEVYYNFEVIADPTTAPFLRAAVDTTWQASDKDEIRNHVADMVSRGGLTKPAAPEHDFISTLGRVAELGVKYIPMIASLF